MATYKLELFKDLPTVTGRVGTGSISFDVGDDAAAVRYTTSDLAQTLEHAPMAELRNEGGQLVWEKPHSA